MWIDKFFELLYSKDSEKIKKAYELKNQKMPAALYKYKSIDEEGHTFDLLEKDLIFLSNANNLNDLYEGEFFYDEQEVFDAMLDKHDFFYRFFEKSKLSDEEKRSVLTSETPYLELLEIIYETDPFVNRDIPLEEFKKQSIQIMINFMNKIYQDGNNFNKENTYLTCFSKRNDLILMWSYYTDSNKGICIKYDIKNNYKRFITRSCYPIKYEDGYDYTNELLNMKENMYKLLYDPYLRKERVWSHEKEWRILFNNEILLRSTIKVGDKHFLKLPKPTAIYMGKRIAPENEKKIKEICQNREISLYKMEKDNKKAALYETEILKFSEKDSNDELFIVESIKNKTCMSLFRNYFFHAKSIADIEKGFSKIINVFNDLENEDIQFFLDELLFKNKVFPVLHHYHHNVLLFLIDLYDYKVFNNIKTVDGLSVEENLKKWIDYCHSNFADNKIVRYMIFFERLFIRFYNRYVILSDQEKEIYEHELSNFNLKNKYVSLMEWDSGNEVKYIHPFSIGDGMELIMNDILNNLKTVIELFYIGRNFDEDNCDKEYLKLKSVVEKIEKETELNYMELFKDDKYYPIDYIVIFDEKNLLSSGTKAILMRNKHILKSLSLDLDLL